MYYFNDYPETATTVGMSQTCKQIGQTLLYLSLTPSSGGDEIGNLDKSPTVLSFFHQLINCKKNADSSRPRSKILLAIMAILKK